MTAFDPDQLADAGLTDYLATLGGAPSARDLGVEALREASSQRAAARPRGPELAVVEDLKVEDVAVRLYRPGHRTLPLVVFAHGGGWTIGDLETHDRTCRRLANAANVAVLAVDYRRAPEHPWPAAVDDTLAVLRWAMGSGRSDLGALSVGVMGDSAGGTIAALCCLRQRDEGEPQPALQVLAYPNTDLTFSQPSVAAKAQGWGLTADDALWFAEQWVPDAGVRADPRVSPLQERDLAGLAAALVVTAEHDVLRDEGDAYAGGLRTAGVEVEHRVEAGLVHGFLGLDLVSPAAGAASGRLFRQAGWLLRAAATSSAG